MKRKAKCDTGAVGETLPEDLTAQAITETVGETLPTEQDVAHAEDQADLMEQAIPAEPLVSALDIATARSQFDSTPLTRALITELERTTGGAKRNWPTLFTDGGPLPRPTSETVNAIVFDSGTPLCTPDDLAQLQDLQARFEATFKTAERYALSKTSDYLFAARDEMQARLHAGEDVNDITMPTRETVFHNLLAKGRALNALLLKMTQEETVPLCRPILERFELCLDAWLCAQEENDKALCAGYHLEFKPSYLWRAGAVIALHYTVARKLPLPHVTATPRQVLEGLVNL